METSKPYVPEEYIPSTHEVLGCLGSESQWLKLLKGRNKPYEKLLTDLEMHFSKMFIMRIINTLYLAYPKGLA
jgi:hypothetical protein